MFAPQSVEGNEYASGFMVHAGTPPRDHHGYQQNRQQQQQHNYGGAPPYEHNGSSYGARGGGGPYRSGGGGRGGRGRGMQSYDYGGGGGYDHGQYNGNKPFSMQQQQQQAPPYPSQYDAYNGSGNPGSDSYEVHDNHLKAPISVRYNDVVPTLGSARLFSMPPQPIHSTAMLGGSNRTYARICELFQHGQCMLGDECPDVHVVPDLLQSIRGQLSTWLQQREAEFTDTMASDPTTPFRVFCADLKEVVEVPIFALSFTRGLYVDPSARAKRSRFGHQSAFALMAAQVPTACGLHSVDPAQCRWGRWCNQAHIDPSWMRAKRDEFENWSHSLESQFQQLPQDHIFFVHDPQTKASIQVPKNAVAEFSRGLFQGSMKKAPSVCMLFQRGRCTAHGCCNQIHVQPEFLRITRQYHTEGVANGGGYQHQHQHGSYDTEQHHQHAAPPYGAEYNLNPKARPFVPSPAPEGENVVEPPLGQPQQGMVYLVVVDDALGDGSQLLVQQPSAIGDSPSGVRAKPPRSGAEAAVAADDAVGSDDNSLRQQSQSQTSQTSSPLKANASPPNAALPPSGKRKVDGVEQRLQTRPPNAKKSQMPSPLADLRADEDEVYVAQSASVAPPPATIGASSPQHQSPSTPIKQNNPYTAGTAQHKAIGVPPSPMQSVTTMPNASLTQPPSRPTSTPLMQFGWVQPCKSSPQSSVPPPSPPFVARRTTRTPTSPHALMTLYGGDLTNMHFSPSPLMRSVSYDTNPNVPKNLSFEGIDDMQTSGTMMPPSAYQQQYGGNKPPPHHVYQQQHFYQQQQQQQQPQPGLHANASSSFAE